MQLRLFASLLVFAGSYFPLSLILLVQDFDYKNFSWQLCFPYNNSDCFIPFYTPFVSITVLIVSAASFLLTLGLLRFAYCKHQVKITEATHVPSDLMSYVVPYIVSFMNLSYQDTKGLLGYALFLAWIFWITHKSGRVMLNPMLIVLGWRLYEVAYVNEASRSVNHGYVLSNFKLESNSFIKYKNIQDVMVCKEKVND